MGWNGDAVNTVIEQKTTWAHMVFGSGTQIVTSGIPGKPHLYIYGPYTGDEADGERSRFNVCEEILAFMNGGTRPIWLDDLKRISEDAMVGIDGTRIDAAGPMIDRNPPHLEWWTDDSQEAKDARARLIDRLQGIA